MNKIFTLAIALIAGNQLLAQSWTGAVNSDWNNPSNWSQTPGNGDDIDIDPANYTGAAAQPTVTGISVFTPGEMLIQGGAQLTIAGTLNASDRVEVLGAGTKVIINSGTFALTGGGNNARLIFAEEAHLQMEGGNLTSGQRLLFELGATGEINAGNVTVGETIALVDGSVSGSSKLIQNGGTITANGEFGFENEAGQFFPAFEQTGGTLQVNGALVWLGAAPGSGRGYFRSTGGNINVTGAIGNDPTSTMGMQIELSGSNALFQNSGNAVDALAGDSIIIGNGAKWTDVNAVSWQNAGVVHAFGGSVFQSGNTTLNGAGTYQFDTVIVPASRLLNHATPATIAVSGNLEIAGVFNHGTNKLVLNGDAPQTITTTVSGLNVHQMEIANAASGVTFNNHLNIVNHLELTDGILTAVPTATVKLADNATIAGGSDTTFIDGYVEKSGNDAILIPLGIAPEHYRPLSIGARANASTVIRVGYKLGAFTSLLPVETPLQSVSAIEYWDLSRTGSTDLFSATIGWNDASESGLTNCNDISMTVWNGTEWKFVASTTAGLCDGTNDGNLTSSAQLPAIGPLTIGFTENVSQNAVEICAGGTYSIGTHVYDESGVYIDVLEDMNGDDSTVVTILTVLEPVITTVTNHTHYLSVEQSAGSTYQWIDCNNQDAIISGATDATFNPVANGSYAVIVTQGACSDTSACEIIAQLGLQESAIENTVIYPNPVASGGKLSLTMGGKIESVEIRSLDGRLVQMLSVGNESVTDVSLPTLSSGTYLLLLSGQSGSKASKRFTVQNH